MTDYPATTDPTAAIAEALDQIGRAIKTLCESYIERGDSALDSGPYAVHRMLYYHQCLVKYEEYVGRRAKEGSL